MRVSLGKALTRALEAGREPLGQLRGPIRPGPRSYAVCRPCTDEAVAAQEALPRSMREGVRPRGWLRRDLPRHLRDYHGVG